MATTKKTSMALAAGAALTAGLTLSPLASAETNPFASVELSSGYMQLAEGNCGANKKAEEAKCGANKMAEEAKDKADMKAEEGKCGENKAKAEAAKMKEGKCGEAKCGANKK